VLAAAIVGLLVATVALVLAARADRQEITYTEFTRALASGRVERLTVFPGDRIEGEWLATAAGDAASFTVSFPVDAAPAWLESAAAMGVDVSFGDSPAGGRYRSAGAVALQVGLVGLLVTVLVLHLRGQFGGRGFATPVAGSDTNFSDVAGMQGADQELREIIEFLRRPGAFAAMGARVPRGVLLVGPPGTGKTLLARAVAGEAGVPFYQLSGAEVTGFVVGLGAHRIRSLFRRARRSGGVVFIDEIDALGGRRGQNRSHNEDDRTLNQLLVEMDGFASTDGVVVIGATNRADDLDPALKRPGRFDRIVSVALPTAAGREEILRLHAKRRGVPLAADVDIGVLARLMPGASGAELANLLNEAAIAAVRDGSYVVEWRHFESARDRMLLGKERVGFTAPDREWRIVAYHEAGHALAGVLCVPEDGLHKVTIQPRGHAMGVAFFAADGDRHLYSRRYLEGQIVKGLAGRAAEEIVFGPEAVTGGAENDLVQVNRIARTMVYRLGMGRETGLLVHDEGAPPLSPAAQAEMDGEVRRLLDRLYEFTRTLLQEHRTALDALAAALLEHETLDGATALQLLEEHGVSVGAAAAQPN